MLFPFSFLQSQVDIDAAAFFERVTAAGGTLTATEKSAVNKLVIDLKTNSLWSGMKAIYPMVGSSAEACKQNLVSSSFTGIFSSGWTFSSSGAKPNGTSAYMDTQLNFRSQTSLNNVSFGSYWNDYITNSTNKYYGAYDASGISLISQKTNQISGDHTGYLNSFTGIYAIQGNGLHGISRILSTEIVFYQKTNKTSSTSISSTAPNLPFYLGGVAGISSFGYIQFNYAFSYISTGFTDTTWNTFNSIVQTFQTTLSRQV